jgi:hypothetical protein
MGALLLALFLQADPANPEPCMKVRFGQQSWEEMLIGYVDFVRAE